jgi:hypothetical protein
MTERVKGNEEIREGQKAFLAAYHRAKDTFGAIPGVEGVGFGHKETGGRFKAHVVITVFVREKKADQDLPAEQRIPPTFEGYATDVRVVPKTRMQVCDNTTKYEVIQGGIQIQAEGAILNGTLGCIVRKRGDTGRENVYLLTCKHVLFSGTAGKGSYVYHPFPPGQGNGRESLGPVQERAFREDVSFTWRDGNVIRSDNFFLDCATALIVIDSKCWGTTCTKDTLEYTPMIVDLQVAGGNAIGDVRSVIDDVTIVLPEGSPPDSTTPRVFKVGRTTGKTTGIVRSVALLAHMPDDTPQHNVIEIEFDPDSEPTHLNCKGHHRFSEEGDSGSLVVDAQGRAIGLLFGGFAENDRSGASHIAPVLQSLGICIPTAGGSARGSCEALDGTGITPVAPTREEVPPDGQIHPTRHAVVASGPHFPEPIPISAAERDRMLVLLDRLRETAYGIELHETFGDLRREIGYLVRNARPVKVVWHRHRGPAFLAHVLNHLKGDTDAVPHEIAGISREALLARMGEVLAAQGSRPLRAALERHGPVLLTILCQGDNVHDWLNALPAEVTL